MEKTKKKANGYAVYLDVKHKKQAQIIDFVDDLNEFYKLLDCDCIDITYRQLNRKCFAIICDDEGALKSNPVPSGFAGGGHLSLVGNLLVVSEDVDDEGNMIGLTHEEAMQIVRASRLLFNNKLEMHPVLVFD